MLLLRYILPILIPINWTFLTPIVGTKNHLIEALQTKRISRKKASKSRFFHDNLYSYIVKYLKEKNPPPKKKTKTKTKTKKKRQSATQFAKEIEIIGGPLHSTFIYIIYKCSWWILYSPFEKLKYPVLLNKAQKKQKISHLMVFDPVILFELSCFNYWRIFWNILVIKGLIFFFIFTNVSAHDFNISS